MCRMIGFSFEKDLSTISLFEGVQKLAEKGLKAPHNNGWGCYLKNVRKEVFFYKSLTPVFEDDFENFDASVGLFHARKASPGLKHGILQIHPFMIGDLIFCHNGTVKDANINNPFSSDSFYLLDQLKDFTDFKDLANKLIDFKDSHTFTAINFLLIKNFRLYAFRLFNREGNYYTLYEKVDRNGIVFASEPLDSSFELMPNGMLVEVESGKLIHKINLMEKNS